MGPSGAGKSTLLHILGMHDNAWTGEFFFDDQAVTD
jgi:ABC-type lipoprotein export system ATPase subunit